MTASGDESVWRTTHMARASKPYDGSGVGVGLVAGASNSDSVCGNDRLTTGAAVFWVGRIAVSSSSR